MAMADHWIAKAVQKHKGKFSAMAKRKGVSTLALARKDSDKGGTVGKEAVLAKTLIEMHKK